MLGVVGIGTAGGVGMSRNAKARLGWVKVWLGPSGVAGTARHG